MNCLTQDSYRVYWMFQSSARNAENGYAHFAGGIIILPHDRPWLQDVMVFAQDIISLLRLDWSPWLS